MLEGLFLNIYQRYFFLEEELFQYLTVNECVSEAVLKFSAPKNEHLVIGELSEDHEELEEQIEAVHCYCGNGALKTPKITEKTSALRIVGDNFRKCNDFVSLFDRYVMP